MTDGADAELLKTPNQTLRIKRDNYKIQVNILNINGEKETIIVNYNKEL